MHVAWSKLWAIFLTRGRGVGQNSRELTFAAGEDTSGTSLRTDIRLYVQGPSRERGRYCPSSPPATSRNSHISAGSGSSLV